MNNDKFVSRGGIKLQAALENFDIDVIGKTVLDVGSSTGGFVDCLLQNGAAKVYSVDTAYGELAWKLRNDPKVVVMERTNILHLKSLPPVVLNEAKRTEESPTNVGTRIRERSFANAQDDNKKVDLVTIDASWTKLELILPVVQPFLKPDGTIIALLKPHYQANKNLLRRTFPSPNGKGKTDSFKGVLPKEIAEQVKDEVIKKIQDLGFKIQEVIESPILGGGGNTEYLLLIIC